MDMQWKVQVCTPRDHFEPYTLTVEQWLAGEGESWRKWEAFMEACALARPAIRAQDGLRQAPRVGYDPTRDQPFFLFKASNNGTTVLVSPEGVDLPSGDLL